MGGDFVNLQWEKPESDGGSRVKGYWVEKREVGSNLWQYVNQFIQAATQINEQTLSFLEQELRFHEWFVADVLPSHVTTTID